jgi:hypothetical protein
MTWVNPHWKFVLLRNLNVQHALEAHLANERNRKDSMFRYLYVLAIVTTKIEDPGSIRFIHTLVDAPDESTAYSEGGKWADLEHTFRPEIETCNDYVVRLISV